MSGRYSREARVLAAVPLLVGLWAPLSRGAADRDIERTLAAAADGTVEVSVISGDIEVACWGQPEVRLLGTVAESAELIFERRGDRIEVKVEPRGRKDSGRASLQLHVPCGGLLSVSTVSAEVEVEGDRDELEVSTVSGAINLQLSAAEINLQTVSGRARLRGDADRLEVDVVSGELEIEGRIGHLEAECFLIEALKRLDVMGGEGEMLDRTFYPLTRTLIRSGDAERDHVAIGIGNGEGTALVIG